MKKSAADGASSGHQPFPTFSFVVRIGVHAYIATIKIGGQIKLRLSPVIIALPARFWDRKESVYWLFSTSQMLRNCAGVV
jgi:hypothetical protein